MTLSGQLVAMEEWIHFIYAPKQQIMTYILSCIHTTATLMKIKVNVKIALIIIQKKK